MSFSVMASAGSKALGDRFSLVNVIPATVPAAVLLILMRGGAYSGEFSWSRALPDLGAVTGGGALLFVAGVLMLGVVLAPFQVGLVRILEGYWGGSRFAIQLAGIGIEIQRRRLASTIAAMNLGSTEPAEASSLASLAAHEKDRRKRLAKAVSAAGRRERFPAESLLLPTALGNVLRAAETSAGERYGLGTIATFPRLRHVLSSRLDASLSQLLTQLDTAAALCISFVLSAGLSIPLLSQGWLWLVPTLFLTLAVLSYRGAGTAAVYHGQLLDVAYDLHRFELLQALHYELPIEPRDELRFNQRLSKFLASRALAIEGMPDPYLHRPELSEPVAPGENHNPGDPQDA